MSNPGYTLLGWIVWQIARRVAKRKLQENRVKVGAVAAVVLVIVAGIVAARSGGDEG